MLRTITYLHFQEHVPFMESSNRRGEIGRVKPGVRGWGRGGKGVVIRNDTGRPQQVLS